VDPRRFKFQRAIFSVRCGSRKSHRKRRVIKKAYQQTKVNPWKYLTVNRNLVLLTAQHENFNITFTPNPHLRHIKLAINIQLVESTPFHFND